MTQYRIDTNKTITAIYTKSANHIANLKGAEFHFMPLKYVNQKYYSA